jgi:hypothetical protein
MRLSAAPGAGIWRRTTMDSVESVVATAMEDLHRACTAIDELRERESDQNDTASFELGEASQAAHRALLALQGWAPSGGLPLTALAG